MTVFRNKHGGHPANEVGGRGGSRADGNLALAGFGIFLALWPVLIVHAAYAIAIAEEYVPLCNPYWDGCTSISRAGRHGWANHLFRGALLPYTVPLAFYWWLNQRWLIVLGARGSTAMLVSGWTGALFMVLYVTFLGTEGPTYQLMRRYGINVYFGGTFLAQAMLALRVRRLQAEGRGPSRPWVAPGLAALAGAVLAIGLVYVGVRLGLATDQDRWENALEWTAALGMQLMVGVTVLGWQGSRLTLRIDRAEMEPGRSPEATGEASRRRGEP